MRQRRRIDSFSKSPASLTPHLLLYGICPPYYSLQLYNLPPEPRDVASLHVPAHYPPLRKAVCPFIAPLIRLRHDGRIQPIACVVVVRLHEHVAASRHRAAARRQSRPRVACSPIAPAVQRRRLGVYA